VFCTHIVSFEHEKECANVIACPHCGRANPKFANEFTNAEVITIDSPPSQQAPPARRSSPPHMRFQGLDHGTVQQSRQMGTSTSGSHATQARQIAPGRTDSRPNAGSRVLSTRQHPSNAAQANIICTKVFSISVTLYYGELEDKVLRRYSYWKKARKC
jgi:hypothetical protein